MHPRSLTAIDRLATAAATADDEAALAEALRRAARDALGADAAIRTTAPAPGAGGAAVCAAVGVPGHAVVFAPDPPRVLGEEELAVSRALAAVTGAGLARLAARRRRADRDGALARAARALNVSRELDGILAALAREAAGALGARCCVVHVGGREQAPTAVAGHDLGGHWHGTVLDPDDGAAGRALATGRTAAAHDEAAPLPALAGCRTVLAAPIAWDGELEGVITVGWEAERPVADDDRRTLEAVADLATVACRNAASYEDVQRAARTDSLTGLLNHGAMFVRLREEIARAARAGGRLGIVMLDLDDFKRVNDVSGHQAGDEVLRRVAGILRGELRPYDQVARYGGDEFVLLLPGSDEPTAYAVGERVRDALAVEVHGGCSVGVASWREGLDADDLLEQADHALLLAKRTGKGLVRMANAEAERELALVRSHDGSPAAVQALAAAIEERDAYTREHSDAVVRLARGVAMLLGLGTERVERIAQAALLHDVGKLTVPREILHKPGPLTPEEWALMAEHPQAGERLLLRIPQLAAIAVIVRHEHEHWDGTGYPDGLAGRAIPLGSRVILACDAYHAMVTGRPYRSPRTAEQAHAELRRRAGAQFDPEVVEALLDLLGDAPPQVTDRASGVRLPAPSPRPPAPR